MTLKNITASALVAGAAFLAFNANAAIVANTDVTPNAIFGSGNANGGFAVDTQNNVELGLRAKVRFPKENTFPNNGTTTYTFDPGNGPGNPTATRPLWNFEWSVNSNVDGRDDGAALSDYRYLLSIDTDPGVGTSYITFDPINVPYADNSIGTNSTPQGGGEEAANPLEYAALISENNVAQNSWWLGTFLDPTFDPNATGIYNFMLEAFSNDGTRLAKTEMNVEISAVPLPAALPLYGAGLAALGFMAWRRKNKAKAA
ncbi:VPLPA-CTERM sorting domain-containing protein [Sneathiella marina]|uniref:VPLPA-CTERM sorting domain-containing protein n=1 Tax=Sneathiella marina TaxID=2950108 RepID=A0ABY4W9L5_9PROT|nr:VPLPA-CTERM sorting domain-containing protein [Sneathiella marina]USG62828.1 VPLPA-CTERM sorting domain-containing protein [Sneathiella marina]